MLKEYAKPQKPSDEQISASLREERDRLFAFQMKVKEAKLPVMVVFEGWGAAGKGGVLGKVIKNIDPRFFQVATLDHTPSREEILDSYYMARGLLTDEAVGHMDEKLRRSAAPVMTHRNKDTLFTLSQEQMEHLRTHVEKTVCTMADHLRSGDFTPAPRRLKDADPCAYCTFHDLCGFDTTPKPVSLSKEEKKKSLYEVFERKEQEDAELDTTAD